MTRASISRTSSSASFKQPDQPYNVHDAALFGALSAFAKRSSTPKSHLNTHSGSNGAPAAAANAGNKRLSTPPRISNDLTPIVHQGTGNSSVSGISIRSAGTNNLEVPSGLDRTASRPRSSSDIAAKLAAARHTAAMSNPPSSGPPRAPHDVLPASGTVQSAKARLGALSSSPDEHRTETLTPTRSNQKQDAEATDSTPIAPTTSLVRLFEQNSGDGRQEGTIRKARGRPPPTKSVKPQIVLSRAATSDVVQPLKQKTLVQNTTSQDVVETKAPLSSRALSTPGAYDGPSPDGSKWSSSYSTAGTDTFRSADYPRPKSQVTARAGNEPDSSAAKLPENDHKHKPKPDLPPPRRVGKTPTQVKPSSDSELQPARGPLKKAAGNDISTRPLPLKRLPSPPEPFKRTTPPIANPYQHQSLRQLQPHMTGDSLANAIVGAHLATSRAPSPSRSPGPPLPQRQQQHHHHHHNHPFHHSRAPSPSKPRSKPPTLRQTMRKEPSSASSDSDSGRPHRGRKHLVRKHPHKHREGDRKRWRDAITERERKRYEGVWAANRGLHLGPLPQYHDEVLDLVVRDIWARSRLPGEVLGEVWELVDSRAVGRLLREEFVVGLWLIDQRLKGRKLPVRVGESVWGSVRWAGGIRVPRRIG